MAPSPCAKSANFGRTSSPSISKCRAWMAWKPCGRSCAMRHFPSSFSAPIRKKGRTPPSRRWLSARLISLPSPRTLLRAIWNPSRCSWRKRSKSPGRPAVPANRVIAIGISTGGPNALQYFLSQIPADFPATIVIVQHMPEGFTDMFARRLDECCAIDVHEAKSGDLLIAGRALICPGNRHMMVRRMPRGEMVVLSDTSPINGHRPSADVLFHSVAQEFGPTSVGIIMTGMGEDGAEGMGAIKAAGGMTIAQSEETCVVSGMPRAAMMKGYVQKILPLDSLAGYLLCNYGPSTGATDKQDVSEKSDKSEKSSKGEKVPVSTPRA